ncbi:hypothetical protein WBO78_23900 [Bosea sp. CCNWLW174]|uniref:hypothetical protein n=1 Tax=unclassified Bosea (in: a-proteobacteria) TaxID=2653178 RepID=UPI0030143984
MDAQTISAFAATGAAIAAATVAGIQLYVGHRQSKAALLSADAALMNAKNAGRHKIADSRQKWIDKVIDALSEHHAILIARPDHGHLSPDDARKLAALRTKIEILLNPDESDTIALLKVMDAVESSDTATARELHEAEMVAIARRLLKAEWVRIKNELQ